jgi:hypothetical protein
LQNKRAPEFRDKLPIQIRSNILMERIEAAIDYKTELVGFAQEADKPWSPLWSVPPVCCGIRTFDHRWYNVDRLVLLHRILIVELCKWCIQSALGTHFLEISWALHLCLVLRRKVNFGQESTSMKKRKTCGIE